MRSLQAPPRRMFGAVAPKPIQQERQESNLPGEVRQRRFPTATNPTHLSKANRFARVITRRGLGQPRRALNPECPALLPVDAMHPVCLRAIHAQDARRHAAETWGIRNFPRRDSNPRVLVPRPPVSLGATRLPEFHRAARGIPSAV